MGAQSEVRYGGCPNWWRRPLPTKNGFIHFEEDLRHKALLNRSVSCPDEFWVALLLEQARTPAVASAAVPKVAPRKAHHREALLARLCRPDRYLEQLPRTRPALGAPVLGERSLPPQMSVVEREFYTPRAKRRPRNLLLERQQRLLLWYRLPSRE